MSKWRDLVVSLSEASSIREGVRRFAFGLYEAVTLPYRRGDIVFTFDGRCPTTEARCVSIREQRGVQATIRMGAFGILSFLDARVGPSPYDFLMNDEAVYLGAVHYAKLGQEKRCADSRALPINPRCATVSS